MSHSRYQTYSECGEKYRLARVERVPQTPGIYRVAGTVFHEWTDYYDTMPPFEVDVSHEDWYTNRLLALIAEEEEKSGFEFRQWDNPAHGKDVNEKARDKFVNDVGPDMIRKYIDWRANTAWSIATVDARPGIELKLTFTIQGVEFVVVLDRVFERPEEGDLVVVDTKTWSKRRVTAQLPTYTVAIRQVASNVTGAGYYEARKGATTDIKSYSHWDENRLAALYVQAAWMISEEWFLPNPGDHCRMCDVRRHCRWFLD